MKYFFLFLVFLLTSLSYSQEEILTIDSTSTVIPRFILNSSELNSTIDKINPSKRGLIAEAFGEDSIYVYQTKKQGAYLLIGSGVKFVRSDISMRHDSFSERSDVYHWFELDSLGTDRLYLLVHWDIQTSSSHSKVSGSDEYMCNETILTSDGREEGITIISLDSMHVLFKGGLEVNEKEVKTKNPGSYEKVIRNDRILKARFWPEESVLNLMDDGNYNHRRFYDDLPYGFYKIVGDQFVLHYRR